MRNIRRIQALKVIVFCLLLCVTLGIVAIPFTNPHDYRAYEWARSLGEERKGALDVVFIGSSNTYAFYAPLLAWKYFGVAAHTYAFSSQKPEAFKYMIEEARKTQPDAVYVISLGNVSLDNEIESVHYLTDWMPCSLNRLRLLLAYFKYNDYSVYEQTELLFPFFRYHSRWAVLESTDFKKPPIVAKGGSHYFSFVQLSEDITSSVRLVTDRRELNEDQLIVLTDLMDYIRDNQLRVVFLAPPQMALSAKKLAMQNSALDVLTENGFPVLYREDYLDEVGYDYVWDYYNSNHTNIHGAAKYTRYITQYLIDNYGFRDKRGDPDYADFDEAYEEFYQIIAPFVLDFELEPSARDLGLSAPLGMTVERLEDSAVLSWDACPGADGYLIYRQIVMSEDERTPWERIADLDGARLRYVDPAPEQDTVFGYTVVPYSRQGDAVRYGSFVINGIHLEVTNYRKSSL